MKKYFPVILILATLTLSACGGQEKNNNLENKRAEENQKTESKSLKDLLSLGNSQKCTYESTEDGEGVKGEIIINGKKFKQTVEINNKEGTSKIYSLSDGIYYYSWSESMKGNGTKMKMADLEEQENNNGKVEENNETEKEVNINQKIDYKCSPANLSDSDLALPSDVKFVDYTEMMKGLQNGNIENLKKLIPSQEE